jgi:ethanolamine utilization protein EutN
MYYGRIVGHATATVKHPSLDGARLLLVMALQADGHTPEGDPILVIDRLGAGHNETVMVTSDGLGAGELLHSKNTPVRWSVLGIPDGKRMSLEP